MFELKKKIEAQPEVFLRYKIHNGDVYWQHRLVIPSDDVTLVNKISHEFHSLVAGGHFESFRTFKMYSCSVLLAQDARDDSEVCAAMSHLLTSENDLPQTCWIIKSFTYS